MTDSVGNDAMNDDEAVGAFQINGEKDDFKEGVQILRPEMLVPPRLSFGIQLSPKWKVNDKFLRKF